MMFANSSRKPYHIIELIRVCGPLVDDEHQASNLEAFALN